MSNIKLWMPLWVPDFMGDTTHLTTTEIGQYLLLLMAMWRNGGSLPDEPDRLALITKSDKVSPTVMKFFKSKNNTITQKRLTIEFERQKAYRKSQKLKADRRWNKRKLLPPQAEPENAGAYAQQVPPNPNPKKNNNREKEEARQRAALQEILGEQLARAVLDYRHKRKQVNSEIAITRLINQLKKYSNPREGAEEMICRGWSGFNPDWMSSKGRSNGHTNGNTEYSTAKMYRREAPTEPEVVKPPETEREAQIARLLKRTTRSLTARGKHR